MDKSNYGVHRTHCCILHGCKYSDDDCPVASGEIKQEYLCEYCSMDGIKTFDEIQDILLFIRLTNKELLDKFMDMCFKRGLSDYHVSKKQIGEREKLEKEILRRMNLIDLP